MIMLCPVQEKGNAEMLLSYCARTLDPDTQVILERHMEMCPACRRFAAEQQAIWEALASWQPEPVSANFDQRMYARIEAEAGTPWWQRMIPSGMHLSWRPTLSIAAACVTVLAVFLFRAPGRTTGYPPAVRIEMVDVEQAERTAEDLDMLQQFNVTLTKAEPKRAESL
jgi:anti-sigma factor RsiW